MTTPTIGQRIRDRRLAQRLTLEQLAGKTGVARSYIWQLESGAKTRPSAELLDRVAVALSVNVDYLVGQSTLEEAEDAAFVRQYLRLPKSVQAQVRLIADALCTLE